MEPFVGQIILVGFNFAPVGWFLCQGQLVPISAYEALYTLIGTTYGGDGQTTFAVPDLRGRVPTHQGQRSGGSIYVMGERTGTESVTLSSAQIGAHTHPLNASAKFANTTTPGNTTALAPASAGANIFVYDTGAPNTSLAPGSISMTGGTTAAHENRQPFVVFNYIIAWAGIFPSRN
jgi:microcystin-dependent protein